MNSDERFVIRKLARAAAPLAISAKGSRARILSHQVDWHTTRSLQAAGLVRAYKLRGTRVAELTEDGWAMADELAMGAER